MSIERIPDEIRSFLHDIVVQNRVLLRGRARPGLGSMPVFLSSTWAYSSKLLLLHR